MDDQTKRAHGCDVPRCDGTRLGHDLAVEFPEETRQVDEALDRLRTRPDSCCMDCGQVGPSDDGGCGTCGGPAMPRLRPDKPTT